MVCYNHPDKEEIATCSLCGKPICEECSIELAGHVYCKNCVNDLLKERTSEEDNKKQPIETIEPITKPNSIPYEENQEIIIPEHVENPEDNEIVPEVQKAPENYQPDYDYDTEYVETYDDEVEDSYYENPDSIPEPQPEYKNPVVPEEIVVEKQSPINSEDIYVQNDDLESKYERYLEDFYYDEREGSTYSEPQYIDDRYVESQYPARSTNYTRKDYDSEYIVPIHQENNRVNDADYDEIKRRLYQQQNPQKNSYIDDFPMEPRAPRNRRNPQDLEEIQKMHKYDLYDEYYAPKKEGFTTTEIILTIILIILIILVGCYIVYLFALKGSYPTFMDAFWGLIYNPTTFFNHLMSLF